MPVECLMGINSEDSNYSILFKLLCKQNNSVQLYVPNMRDCSSIINVISNQQLIVADLRNLMGACFWLCRYLLYPSKTWLAASCNIKGTQIGADICIRRVWRRQWEKETFSKCQFLVIIQDYQGRKTSQAMGVARHNLTITGAKSLVLKIW